MSARRDRLPRRPADRPLRPRAVGAAVAAAHRSGAASGLGAPTEVRHQPRRRRCSVAQRRRAPARAAGRRRGPTAGQHLRRRRARRRSCGQRRRVGAADRVGRRRRPGRPRDHRCARRQRCRPLRGDVRRRPRAAAVRRSRSRTRCWSSPTPTASGRVAGPACATTSGRPNGSTRRALVTDENDNRSTCSPTQGTDSQTVVRDAGRRGQHEPLRRPRLLRARVPGDAGLRRRHEHRVGGRRARQGDRRAAARSTSTSRSPPTTSTSCSRWWGRTQRYLTAGRPVVRRRRADHRRPRRRVAHRRRPDRHLPDRGRSAASTSPSPTPTWATSAAQPYVEQRRVRRDPPAGRRAGLGARARRRDRAHADRPGRRRGRRTAADRPLVYQMSRSRTVVVPPRYSQDEVALVRRFRVPDDRAVRAARHRPARRRRARRRARRGARHPRR